MATRASKGRRETAPPPAVDEGGKGRATFFLPVALVDRLRDVAWWDRTSLNALAEEALEDLLRKRERKRGDAYPRREGELRR